MKRLMMMLLMQGILLMKQFKDLKFLEKRMILLLVAWTLLVKGLRKTQQKLSKSKILVMSLLLSLNRRISKQGNFLMNGKTQLTFLIKLIKRLKITWKLLKQSGLMRSRLLMSIQIIVNWRLLMPQRKLIKLRQMQIPQIFKLKSRLILNNQLLISGLRLLKEQSVRSVLVLRQCPLLRLRIMMLRKARTVRYRGRNKLTLTLQIVKQQQLRLVESHLKQLNNLIVMKKIWQLRAINRQKQLKKHTILSVWHNLLKMSALKVSKDLLGISSILIQLSQIKKERLLNLKALILRSPR